MDKNALYCDEMSSASGQYTALAPYYDLLNSEVDYCAWADFISKTISMYYFAEPSLVLELGCGTGNMTRELSARGFDMIGIDISDDMLAVAMQHEYENACLNDINADNETEDTEIDVSAHRPLYLHQDMCSFELYGTVDAAVCCIDGINYLTEDGDLERCFKLVHNYLNPNGIFIFDVNSPYKFENIFACNDIVLEREGLICAWRNNYDIRSSLCEFDLSIFVETNGAVWKRLDEVQIERCYGMDEICCVLKRVGFELIKIVGDIDGGDVHEKSERWFFIVRAIKLQLSDDATKK